MPKKIPDTMPETKTVKGEEVLLKAADMCIWLGVPRQTLYRWRKEGSLPPAINVGGEGKGSNLRWRPKDVRRWLRERKEASAQDVRVGEPKKKEKKEVETVEDMRRSVRRRMRKSSSELGSQGIDPKKATTPKLLATHALCAAIERGYSFLLDTLRVSMGLLTYPVREGDNRSKIPWDTMSMWHNDRAEEALSLAVHHYEMSGLCMWGKKRRMPEEVLYTGNKSDETVHASEVEILMVPRGKKREDAVHLLYLVKQEEEGWCDCHFRGNEWEKGLRPDLTPIHPWKYPASSADSDAGNNEDSSAEVTQKEGPESFTFLNTAYNVEKAKAIVADRDEPDGVIEVDVWAFQLRVDVDWEYVESDEVDLTKPLIMAWFEGKKEAEHIIIDGYHRLAKARREGVKMLPVYELSKEESKEVRFS